MSSSTISASLTAIPSRNSLFFCRAWSATSLWCDQRLSLFDSLSLRKNCCSINSTRGLRLYVRNLDKKIYSLCVMHKNYAAQFVTVLRLSPCTNVSSFRGQLLHLRVMPVVCDSLSLCDLRVWLKGFSDWKPLQLRYFRALPLSLWVIFMYDRFLSRLRSIPLSPTIDFTLVHNWFLFWR